MSRTASTLYRLCSSGTMISHSRKTAMGRSMWTPLSGMRPFSLVEKKEDPSSLKAKVLVKQSISEALRSIHEEKSTRNPFKRNFKHGRINNEAFVVAKQLVDMTIGSFEGGRPPKVTLEPTKDHYQTAADLIQFFLYERAMCASSTRAITATFAVVERVLRELAFTRQLHRKMHYVFSSDKDFFRLMNFWKNAVLADEAVLPAVEMLKKVQWFLSVVPDHKLLRFDKPIFLMFMQIVLKQSTKRQGPLVAQGLMEFAESIMKDTKTNYLEPDAEVYEYLLQAWANSDSPHTTAKLEEVMNEMQRRDISLNVSTYAILIRYWAVQGNLIQAKAMLDIMSPKGMEPDLQCIFHMLQGYTRLNQPLPAVGYLDKMYRKFAGTPEDAQIITSAMLNTLEAFKRLILLEIEIRRNVLRAEDVLRTFESNNIVPNGSDARVYGAMMDIYASAGRADEAEAMMNKIDHNDPVKYTTLVRAYGKASRADLAMDVVFKRMPQDPHVVPAPHVYKALIEAWTESHEDDAIKQAYSVMQSMDENEFCRKHRIRPDASMFVALLKCINVHKRLGRGSQVLVILDDVELRSREKGSEDLHLHPDIYKTALNVSLQGKHPDLSSAETILERMVLFDPPPDMSFYGEVLNRYAKIGTTQSAEYAEKILLRLKELSKTNTQLKPNASTYNAVIMGWIEADDHTSSTRAWTIYEKMEHDFVRPTMKTFTAMISYFSKSIWGRKDVSRADRLLTLMESGELREVAPDRRHYGPVMNGWIALGDIEKAADVLMRRIKTFVASTGRMKDQCKPTPDNIYAVANGWISCDELVKATQFVEKMQTLRDKNILPDGPDIYIYLELHNAWKSSDHPYKEENIEKLDATVLRIRPLPERRRPPPEEDIDEESTVERYNELPW